MGVLEPLQTVETVLVSIVTAPLIAMARPHVTEAPVVSVTLSMARMLPSKAVVMPKVAELPTSQMIVLSAEPSSTVTDEAEAVVSVEPISKIKLPVGSEVKLRIRFPVSWADESNL